MTHVPYRWLLAGEEVGRGSEHAEVLTEGNVVASGVRAYRIVDVEIKEIDGVDVYVCIVEVTR